MTERIKFTVVRERWGRGSRGGLLFRPETGKMCCLGFLAEHLGYTRDQFENIACPNELGVDDGLPRLFPTSLVGPGAVSDVALTPTCSAIMQVNDTVHGDVLCGFMDDGEREARLTELFAEADIEVSFV